MMEAIFDKLANMHLRGAIERNELHLIFQSLRKFPGISFEDFKIAYQKEINLPIQWMLEDHIPRELSEIILLFEIDTSVLQKETQIINHLMQNVDGAKWFGIFLESNSIMTMIVELPRKVGALHWKGQYIVLVREFVHAFGKNGLIYLLENVFTTDLGYDAVVLAAINCVLEELNLVDSRCQNASCMCFIGRSKIEKRRVQRRPLDLSDLV
jgi:hypothetical protein